MTDTPHAKKSLGQHWLYDTDSLRTMCDAAEVSDKDTVLEIGPGLGTLTELLVQRAGNVVAVEFDAALAQSLPAKIASHNLKIVHQDILKFNLTTLPASYKVVANIPYYLTSNLIRVLSESSNPPSMAVLLVQKEVAERVAAEPGDMSLLSVTAQFYWEVSLGRIVKAELFTPPPKVDSQILIMNHRQEQLFTDVDPKRFFSIVRAGFSQRRKTLLNSLSAGLQLDKEVLREMLTEADIEPGDRAQNLPLEAWHRLAKIMR